VENNRKVLNYAQERKHKLQSLKEGLQERSLSSEQYKRALSQFYKNESAALRMKRNKVTCNSFTLKAQIGQGAYGYVYLAEKRDNGLVCAFKKMNKKLLIQLNDVENILSERDALVKSSTSEWLVQLYYAFQDKEYVYLAMEYVPGGDFRTLLNKIGVMRENQAMFYFAEMAVAVNELHGIGFMYTICNLIKSQRFETRKLLD
jgi:cell cycle protein kinase DBF2